MASFGIIYGDVYVAYIEYSYPSRDELKVNGHIPKRVGLELYTPMSVAVLVKRRSFSELFDELVL